MRRFFTKHLLLMVLGFVAIDMMGQKINTLVIDAPASIAGNYSAVRASFGVDYVTPITADAAFGTDGTATGTLLCAAATNDLTGKIGFVDRGGCNPAVNGEFGSKALKAQQAGAVAVIICNNMANATQAPFSMTTGTNGGQVTVPTFMISYNDCQKIRASILDGTAKATLKNVCLNTGTYGPEVVWGQIPGQGDFTGGLNDWTIDKDNTWQFDGDGEILGGAWGGTVMDSWTDCSGIMKFNSDFLDNNGSQTGAGTGLCPSVCTGALISPNIDLSAHNIAGLSIEFSQATRQFRSEYYIMASKDNGVTWPDTLQINTELPSNSNVINERKKVALLGYAGATQVRFKFEYVGEYYYWGIDDVVLKNETVVDARVNTNFYAVAPTLRVPKTQVAPMPFLADISNIGNGDATGVKLEVVIQNGTDEVARLENVYGNVAAGTSIENVLFVDQFTPPADAAFYEAAYVLTSDNDSNAANDEAGFFFEVTENTFGNLLPESFVSTPNYMEDVTGFWAVTPTNYYSGGNAYFLPEGDGYTVDKVRFGLENALDEIEGTGFVQVDLYEWIDGVDAACSPLERVLVGSNSQFITADEISNARLIEIPLYAVDVEGSPIEGSEIVLKDNANYVLVAHASPLEPSAPRYRFLSYSGTMQDDPFDRSIYNEATNFALTEAGQTRFAGSLWNIEGVDETDIADRIFDRLGNNVTLFSFATMYLEMDIKKASSTYDIAKSGTANVFPNPASRELYIDVTLDNVSANVRVDLVTIEGKVATSKSFTNVQDSRLKLDLSGLTSGTYTAMIHTDNGVIAKKVVVQK